MRTRYVVLVLAGLLTGPSFADDDDKPGKIDLPSPPPDSPVIHDTPFLQEAGTSTDIVSSNAPIPGKEFKTYSNDTVGFQTRVKADWTVTEYKDKTGSAFASFTISRPPGDLVTFAVTRDPLDRSFDEWTSTTSLSQLYPQGFKKSMATFAGRKAVVIEGPGSDGRREQSYFTKDGSFVCQVSFSSPDSGWANQTTTFDDLKTHFQWLR